MPEMPVGGLAYASLVRAKGLLVQGRRASADQRIIVGMLGIRCKCMLRVSLMMSGARATILKDAGDGLGVRCLCL